ncbi:MAG TPA: hypothetical protein VFP27_02630, partial [Mycobacterium sp.]|nr:hypothetical protein [Mycobacterium sp.]
VTKSDATTKPIKLVNRGGTDTKSGNQEPIMGTWRNIHYTLAVNPETGAPFTIAEVNALQSGVESG